jgi:hypothetical protein
MQKPIQPHFTIAAARPIPELAPVTIATLLLKSMIFVCVFITFKVTQKSLLFSALSAFSAV